MAVMQRHASRPGRRALAGGWCADPLAPSADGGPLTAHSARGGLGGRPGGRPLPCAAHTVAPRPGCGACTTGPPGRGLPTSAGGTGPVPGRAAPSRGMPHASWAPQWAPTLDTGRVWGVARARGPAPAGPPSSQAGAVAGAEAGGGARQSYARAPRVAAVAACPRRGGPADQGRGLGSACAVGTQRGRRRAAACRRQGQVAPVRWRQPGLPQGPDARCHGVPSRPLTKHWSRPPTASAPLRSACASGGGSPRALGPSVSTNMSKP